MVVYPPSDAEQIADIIGEDMNDSTMYATALQRALAEKEQDPNDPFAWFNIGSIYNALGNYQQAAANFDVARQTGTPWRLLWYQFGPYEAYYQTGRYEDVLTLAQATTDPENYPESEEAFYYMGLVYEARGELRAARNMYNKALQYNPNYEAAQEALNDLSES
jgi:tetratricopeptide (TPR) repeat protein